MAASHIGILGLQGDVSLHAQALHKLGITARIIKTPQQLKGLQGLIIPGGESTALLKLCEPIGMLEALRAFANEGGSIFGTCAGAILLAKTVKHPQQASLGLVDILIERNAYGRQLDSFEAIGQAQNQLGDGSLAMTFIRAPRITNVGSKVTVLATHQGEAVMVQSGRHLAATFHPELTEDGRVYEYWLKLIRE